MDVLKPKKYMCVCKAAETKKTIMYMCTLYHWFQHFLIFGPVKHPECSGTITQTISHCTIGTISLQI